MIGLRQYQDDLVNRIRASLGAGHKAPLVVAPTGAGKTRVFSHIAAGAREKRNHVLILTHRREILQQTIKTLYSLGVPAGQIMTGKPMTSDLIQVASVQTLVRRLHLVKRPELIITDEAHHTTEKNTWGRIHTYWSSVPNIGFSATPARLDGQGLGDCYDDLIVGPSLQWLVDQGWLSYPALYRPPEEVAQTYHVKRGDFDAGEQFQAMSSRKIVGDVVTHYRRHMDGQPVIVSCVSVEHAKLMADVFTEAGYRSRPVWGDMDDKEREVSLGGLGDGSVQVVTFADLIGEGVDIPAVAGVILLRRTLSLSLYLQIVGRALRPVYAAGADMDSIEGRLAGQHEGPKPKAIILDHAGNYHLHGHVLAAREWSLEGVKRAAKTEKPPTTTACPKCYGVWPGTPRVCPACGYAFTEAAPRKTKDIKIIAGELVEAGLGEDAADQAAAFVASIMRMDSTQRQKAMLGRAFALAGQDGGRDTIKALAAAVGYKQGWADWAWKYTQGRRA
jgi:superfamily II DNA or RNA helicase